MLFILSLPICAIVVLILLWYLRIYSYRSLKNIPRLPMVPLFGHLWYFRNVTALYEVFPIIQEQAKIWGDLYISFTPTGSPYVFARNPKLIEYFLNGTKHITKAYEYKMLEPWLGKGLLTSTGKKWHSRRKIITPTFHFKILEEFIDVINKNGNILVQKISQDAEKDLDDVYPYFNAFTLDVICETAMDTSINAQMMKIPTPYVKAIRDYLILQFEKYFSVWKRVDILYNLLSSGPKKEKEQMDILHNFTLSVIKKRRKELLDNQNNATTSIEPKRRLVFLDRLLLSTEDGQPLSNEGIREEVDTFMFAGHDTTSSSLSLLIYELAKHKDIQEKIFAELNEVFGDNKQIEPTCADLQRLNYLELVIKEGLRLYPAVSILHRLLEEDALIGSEFTGGEELLLPKGTTFVINIYQVHRNTDCYPEPEKFIPERFLKENVVDRSPFQYLPFSAGPRNCIGQKFAMMEMKATLAKIFGYFHVFEVPGHKMQLYSDGVLKSHNGLPVHFKRRS